MFESIREELGTNLKDESDLRPRVILGRRGEGWTRPVEEEGKDLKPHPVPGEKSKGVW